MQVLKPEGDSQESILIESAGTLKSFAATGGQSALLNRLRPDHLLPPEMYNDDHSRWRPSPPAADGRILPMGSSALRAAKKINNRADLLSSP